MLTAALPITYIQPQPLIGKEVKEFFFALGFIFGWWLLLIVLPFYRLYLTANGKT